MISTAELKMREAHWRKVAEDCPFPALKKEYTQRANICFELLAYRNGKEGYDRD